MMDATPYQVMPPLSADEYEALKADIAARGVQVPVEYDEQHAILDGHHRVQICGELGITNWPRLVRYGLSDDEKRRHARRLNLDRRHLNAEQKRALVADDLRERPDASDRQIAAGLGVDHKTVGAVRDGLETTGEIPQLNERKGKDGKARRIVQYVDPSPEGIKGTKLAAKAINEAERTKYRQGAREIAKDLSDAAALNSTGRLFSCVYADPAWSRKAGFGNRAYENQYPTMSWADIISMPVKARLLPNAWGFLWIPRAHMFALHPVEIDTPLGKVTVKMPLAWAVAQAWGFDSYSTCFVWTKTDDDHPEDHGSGLIVWDQDEILLLFKRGNGLPMPTGAEKVGSNHRERPEGHSAKPTFYRDMINRMTGGVQVLELFAREDAEHVLPSNFYTWGNESKNTANDPETGEILDDVPSGNADGRGVDDIADHGRDLGDGSCGDESVGAVAPTPDVTYEDIPDFLLAKNRQPQPQAKP